MAQGRSSKFILMSKWIRTSKLTVKKFLSAGWGPWAGLEAIRSRVMSREDAFSAPGLLAGAAEEILMVQP